MYNDSSSRREDRSGKVKGTTDVVAALKAISATTSRSSHGEISRGTHIAELAL